MCPSPVLRMNPYSGWDEQPHHTRRPSARATEARSYSLPPCPFEHVRQHRLIGRCQHLDLHRVSGGTPHSSRKRPSAKRSGAAGGTHAPAETPDVTIVLFTEIVLVRGGSVAAGMKSGGAWPCSLYIRPRSVYTTRFTPDRLSARSRRTWSQGHICLACRNMAAGAS
eukprot:2845296-Prymnesium_polylepis.3